MKVARMLSTMVVKHYIPFTQKLIPNSMVFLKSKSHTHKYIHFIAQKWIMSFGIAQNHNAFNEIQQIDQYATCMVLVKKNLIN
jgi:ribonucleotide reductase beta subunit family protein with ferritin-like domain